MFADSALILLQTGTIHVNHTFDHYSGHIKIFKHYSTLNLTGHVHIPTSVTNLYQGGKILPSTADAIHTVLQRE